MRWLLPKRRREIYKFDETTGQIYTERTVAVQSSHDKDWAWQPPAVGGHGCGNRRDYSNLANCWKRGSGDEDSGNYIRNSEHSRTGVLRGARSLQKSVIECILQNISNLTLEATECLPKHIVRTLWCLVSFNAWAIFSKVLRNDDACVLGLMRYQQVIKKPMTPLHIYTNHLTSKSFDFITSLSITTHFTLPDLVKLSNVTNIGVLEIINAPEAIVYDDTQPYTCGVGDRLVRAWHLAALDSGAFRVLRILRLWNHEELTSKSLPYLNSFPSLAIFDVRGCGFKLETKTHAVQLGWRPTFESNILGLLENACMERTSLIQSSPDIESRPPRKLHQIQLCDRAKVRWMPRKELPGFIGHSDSSGPSQLVGQCEGRGPSQGTGNDNKIDRSNTPIGDVRWKARESPVIPNTGIFESWHLSNYRAFARVGELRNDTDLTKAGVFTPNQALVDNELVNSIPMVSLCVGQPQRYSARSPDSDWTEGGSAGLSLVDSRNLAFIRIKIPSPAGTAEPVDSTHPTPQSRHEGSGVRMKKRQKMGTLLAEYEYTCPDRDVTELAKSSAYQVG